MDSTITAKRAAFEKQFVGYLLAVSGAAISAVILLFVSVYLSAPNRSFDLGRLWDGIFLTALLVVLFWIYVFFWTIIPFVAVIRVARRFQITSVLYFILSGALTGILLAPALIYFQPRWYTDPPAQPPFVQQVIDILPICVPAGIVGAFLYWWKVGRHQSRSVDT